MWGLIECCVIVRGLSAYPLTWLSNIDVANSQQALAQSPHSDCCDTFMALSVLTLLLCVTCTSSLLWLCPATDCSTCLLWGICKISLRKSNVGLCLHSVNEHCFYLWTQPSQAALLLVPVHLLWRGMFYWTWTFFHCHFIMFLVLPQGYCAVHTALIWSV